MPDASRIVALLGPTNTGKTHRAIERMLEHETALIGLPLRLLAREVYDRLVAKIGRDDVALVTGEEKLGPKRARYVVATVEAMPTQRDFELVAVDEVQLCAHPERGHVFTNRLLHARGTRETWLLGSDTMRPLVRTLVPTAQIDEHPRLSRLSYAGTAKLSHLPPKTAVVAFSMDRVYELAERLRAVRGGAAVVLGALSPRTRNAQVAMFQAGEVEHVVATDAIGMGLNLDLGHVAFAARHKFDGRDVRELDPAELGQIAGRAGRYVRDGTFGGLAPLELPPPIALAIESHRFPALHKIRWRPHLLDLSSPMALLASLAVRSPHPALVPVPDADDARAFARLAAMPEIARTLGSADAVRLLWEVASIPDFRKLLFEAYVDDLRGIYLEIVSRGHVGDDFIARAVSALEHGSGDVDSILARITALRTWTYVANKDEWMDGRDTWREATRALEDRLSDALHAALTQRFVAERRRTARSGEKARPRPSQKTPHARTPVADERPMVREGHPFAALSRLRLASNGEIAAAPIASPLEALVDAPHERFRLDRDAVVWADELRVGRLVRGPRLALPGARVELEPALERELRGGLRLQLERRLLAFARDTAGRLLAPVRALASEDDPRLRGLAHLLEAGLGTALRARAVETADALAGDEAMGARLASIGIVIGTRVIYASALLKPRAIDVRATLLVCAGRTAAVVAPGRTSIARRGRDEDLLALGFVPLGPRAVRADVAERAAREAESADARALSSILGCNAREAEGVRRALLSA